MPKTCDQCSATMINGVFTHERGCPKIIRVHKSCEWCSRHFVTENIKTKHCCFRCAAKANGIHVEV